MVRAAIDKYPSLEKLCVDSGYSGTCAVQLKQERQIDVEVVRHPANRNVGRGLAPIGDLLKTEVYALSRAINRDGEIIPEATLTKPPSAELRPGQTDQDSLPDYDVLDRILQLYVIDNLTRGEIVARGFDDATVADVLRRVGRAEYKRRQAPPFSRSPRAPSAPAAASPSPAKSTRSPDHSPGCNGRPSRPTSAEEPPPPPGCAYRTGRSTSFRYDS